ncbi:hypothetical protein [Actinophytocola sediminis]
MYTENALVIPVLFVLCVLGAVSAVVPVVGLALLVLLGLVLLGGLVALALAWYATRFEAPEPARPAPVREVT